MFSGDFPQFCFQFLSTLPARGATYGPHGGPPQPGHFYPRSPRGGRHPGQNPGTQPWNFYPRSPRGERPGPCLVHGPVIRISIHAPREGSDRFSPLLYRRYKLFLSTLPARGATVYRHVGLAVKVLFLSTLPARGATFGCLVCGGSCRGISIHAPREGSDTTPTGPQLRARDFYPRSPRGERRGTAYLRGRGNGISIHAPREGSDGDAGPHPFESLISIHAPREGSDACKLPVMGR